MKRTRSMHVGLPLLLRRKADESRVRRARGAKLRAIARRAFSHDGPVLMSVAAIVFLLLWLTR